jgi:hypothetical protein
MLAGLTVFSAAVRQMRFDFRFSDGALRDDEIFDSALSVPGRYLVEVGRRMLQAAPTSSSVVIGNPLLPLRAAQMDAWLGSDFAGSGPLILTDAKNFPVAYVLPRRLFDGLERFLLLVSCQDADLDAQLLASVLGVPVDLKVVTIPSLRLSPGRASNGWLNGDGRLEALKRQCRQAVAVIESDAAWQSLPFVNYYPMHAGDVLFMAVASRLCSASFYNKQVVCSAYVDIPAACGSTLETMRLRLPWIARDGSVSEATYFKHAMERLGDEALATNFFVFSRILRLYYTTPFHLVDHARFALGDPMSSFGQTLHAVPSAANQQCSLPLRPLRVLFHLNGGWSLKTYPLDSIRVAISALRAVGAEVTVFDRPDLESAGAVSVQSEDTRALQRHVEGHHLFVGVDSFPHHFSRLVMGWPTIGLFGNTKPCNSDARYSDHYRSSDLNLSCNRCGAYDVCPTFGRKDCANYVPAERVVADIFAMAQDVYGFSP